MHIYIQNVIEILMHIHIHDSYIHIPDFSIHIHYFTLRIHGVINIQTHIHDCSLHIHDVIDIHCIVSGNEQVIPRSNHNSTQTVRF